MENLHENHHLSNFLYDLLMSTNLKSRYNLFFHFACVSAVKPHVPEDTCGRVAICCDWYVTLVDFGRFALTRIFKIICYQLYINYLIVSCSVSCHLHFGILKFGIDIWCLLPTFSMNNIAWFWSMAADGSLLPETIV